MAENRLPLDARMDPCLPNATGRPARMSIQPQVQNAKQQCVRNGELAGSLVSRASTGGCLLHLWHLGEENLSSSLLLQKQK